MDILKDTVDITKVDLESKMAPETPVLHPAANLASLTKLLQTAEHNDKEIKRFLRDNHWPVDHAVRSDLWLILCRHQSKTECLTRDDDFYWDNVKQMFGEDYETNQSVSVPAFVDSQHLCTYHLTDGGRLSANRVCCVLAYTRPEITYSPVIFSLVCAMLHYMTEVDAYHCVCSLLSVNKQGKLFLTQTKVMHEAVWRSIMELTKNHAKSALGNLSKYLKNQETVEAVFEDWTSLIFRHLPFHFLVRVVDCYLYEGSKVLFRVAMAIQILFLKHSKPADSFWAKEVSRHGVTKTLARFCRELPVLPAKLLKNAFRIRSVSHKEVSSILVRSEMYVKSKKHQAPQIKDLPRSWSSEGMPNSTSLLGLNSGSLSLREFLTLWPWLPPRITMYQPELIYTTDEHGCSLMTFYTRVEHREPTILVIKTTNNEVFGAYCSAKWFDRNLKDDSGNRNAYFGTGETFLFTMQPARKKYPWAAGIAGGTSNGCAGGDSSAIIQTSAKAKQHAGELFQAADYKMISVGGGGGQAIFLDENLRFGRSSHCQTFNNPPLCDSKDFECKIVEVFAFK